VEIEAGGLNVGILSQNGNVEASMLDVGGWMTAGILSVTTPFQTKTPGLDFADGAVLDVNGKAVFGSYFPAATNWVSRSSEQVFVESPGASFVAEADGLYVVTVVIRKGQNGTGAVHFNYNGRVQFYTSLTSDQEYGYHGTTLTFLMKKGEFVKPYVMTNPNTSIKTCIYYRSFQKLMF